MAAILRGHGGLSDDNGQLPLIPTAYGNDPPQSLCATSPWAETAIAHTATLCEPSRGPAASRERYRLSTTFAADLINEPHSVVRAVLQSSDEPNPDAVVIAADGQPGAVGAERHRPHPVAAELEQPLPASRIPDPGAGTADGQPGAVRAERHRLHCAELVAVELE